METRIGQTKALRGVAEILRDGTRSQLQLVGPRDIVFCVVKILFYFEDEFHRAEGACDWKRRRDYRIARACYHDLLRSFVPQQSTRVVDALVEIVHEERLWHWEDLCRDLALGLLEYGVGGAVIAHALMNRIEAESTGVRDARAIVRVLYEILDVYNWPKSEETVDTVERLLGLYHDSLSDNNVDEARPRAPLRKGLEVCVRHAIKHLHNDDLLVVIYRMCCWSVNDETTDGTILDFGSTLEYAAYVHEPRLYRDTFDERLFDVLMRMLSSTNRLVSLLGNRVIQYLLDRRGNRSQFDTPKIFFEGMQFDLKINECVKEDKYFLQKKRQIFHDSVLNSMINHCSTRLNLECTYCTVCIIAVEVPCGFTAAALVCLAMNFQDVTFEHPGIRREASYHIHATVMAIMSLLCWIHEAKIFYSYVNKIMTERAQWAPHLNPPIKARYSFAVHHILWDKPEFFFVDWEARYGLWKCFRLRESQQRSKDDGTRKSNAIV